MSHKAAKIARRALRDGVIHPTNKYMVIDQARIDHPQFHDSYTEATADAEERAEQCNGKVEVWTLLRVVPDALDEEDAK